MEILHVALQIIYSIEYICRITQKKYCLLDFKKLNHPVVDGYIVFADEGFYCLICGFVVPLMAYGLNLMPMRARFVCDFMPMRAMFVT